MVCETFSQGDSIVHRLDPRVRVVAAVALSVVTAVASRSAVLAVALGAAAVLAAAAHLPVRATLKRLAPLNAFMLLLFVLLPLSTPGEALLRIGSAAWTREGVVRAAGITLKANAIVLTLTALLSTLDAIELGRALGRLHVPGKLIHLYFFTVRYVDVLHHEYERLRRAMKVRCFRPGMRVHTYRSVGYLVGMLLVKSFDRSERIVAAMKCRGFQGRFVLADGSRLTALDAAFAAIAAGLLCTLGCLQWL
jgi:cobalt/nickel transport system permease protein